MSLLALDKVTIRFGGLTAVDTLNLEVRQGEILALIGPNGAGKSTVFNLITGIYKPTEGNITFADKGLTGYPTYKIAEMGITRTFQTIRLFSDLSVLDNVRIGAHTKGKSGLFHSFTRIPAMQREEAELRDKALAALEFMALVSKRDEKARNLSYGEQRRLEIARALVSQPKILLLDEPAAGMNPQEKVVLMEMIRRIRETGVTVFLVEHDMKLVMGISERIAVLDYGKKIAEGTPQEVRANQAVIEAYLGSGQFKSRIRR
ncbi:MAG TPA: ABC transporter ATP-binding protein [Verrucomicrobiae bacterium]|nr:ABC transporter ATP-binding protein [Verrucomicrobiae bacterium]